MWGNAGFNTFQGSDNNSFALAMAWSQNGQSGALALNGGNNATALAGSGGAGGNCMPQQNPCQEGAEQRRHPHHHHHHHHNQEQGLQGLQGRGMPQQGMGGMQGMEKLGQMIGSLVGGLMEGLEMGEGGGGGCRPPCGGFQSPCQMQQNVNPFGGLGSTSGSMAMAFAGPSQYV